MSHLCEKGANASAKSVNSCRPAGTAQADLVTNFLQQIIGSHYLRINPLLHKYSF